MSAAQQSKPIIIHVLKNRSSNSLGVDFGMDGYDFAKVVQSSDCCPSSGPDQAGARNAWFILQPTSTVAAFKISEIVGGGSGGQSEFSPSASCLVDAAPPVVYAIGSVEARGIHSEERVDRKVQIRVQKLNEKPSCWRFCNKLNIGLAAYVRAAVPCQEFIYIFGPFLDSKVSRRFGYVYNKNMPKGGYMIDAPSVVLDPITSVWAPMEEYGLMLVCFDGDFYVHCPNQNMWSRCSYLDRLPSSISGPTCVLDGILYICDNVRDALYAYKFNHRDEGKLLYSVKLPKLRINGFVGDCFYPEHLVALSDTRLCIIATTMSCLFCAHLEVCFDGALPPPYAKLSGVQCFQKDGIQQVYSCLALSQGMQAMSVLSSLLDQ